MKTRRILMGALVLIVMTAFIVVACSKEKIVALNEDEATLNPKEDDMSAYLKQFKEKMQSAAKGDGTLSVEDARWHLEAVLNYTYGDAGHQTSDVQCDTFYYALHTEGSDVTLAQLNYAYNAISSDVEMAYGNCYLPDKSVLAIQISFKNESKSGDVIVRSILSSRGYQPIKMWFDSTDYWNERYYDLGDNSIEAGGKCGPYVGECLESGAPLELTKKLSLRIPQYGWVHGNTYFTDICERSVSIFSIEEGFDFDYLNDENGPRGFKLYYRNEDPDYPGMSNPDGCICPEEMNYYLSKGPELISHYQPDGMTVMRAYYQSSEILGLREANCFHELVLVCGVQHCNSGDDY